jgi:hypothetical protein
MEKERYGWEVSDKEFRSSMIHGSDRIATALERIAKVLERIAEEEKKQTQYVKMDFDPNRTATVEDALSQTCPIPGHNASHTEHVRFAPSKISKALQRVPSHAVAANESIPSVRNRTKGPRVS